MYFRKLKLIVVLGFLALVWAKSAFGVGLGEITLNSSLNQPLNAEIRLLQVRNLTAEEVLVSLASQEVFRDYGVERPFFLQNLDFDVQLNSASGPVVRVTTRQPIREPFLNFIIELQAPSARLMREYTVLMDLPVFDDQPVAPVQRPQTPAPAQRPQTQTAPAQPQAPAPTQSRPAPRRPAPALPTESGTQSQPVAPRSTPQVSPGADSYTVRSGDTLWEIALAVRPDRGVSVQQTMLALQRLNPEAFIGDNINMLRRGQVLRTPDRSEILQLDQGDAVSEVAIQNNQWQSGSAVGAELVGSRTRPTERDEDGDVRGQVRLTAPGDTQGAGSRSGSGDASAQIESLQNELAINLEEFDRSERENDELRSRVGELEEQIQTMERLIDLNSEEMRDLQVAAEQTAQDGAEELGDQIADAANDDGVIETSPEIDGAISEPAPADAIASTVQEAPPVVAEQPAPAPARPTPADKSLVENILEILVANLLYIGIAIIVILGGVFFLIHRRSQAEMEAYDSLDDEEFYEQDFAEEDHQQESDFADDPDTELDDIGAELDSAEEDEAEVPTEAETEDAVAEADIYIAYGKYDQAAEMLKKAIISDPGNMEARLKLLEVYSESKDTESFDIEYGQLIALGDENATTRAAEMRSSIPGVGQFETDNSPVELEVDSDLSADSSLTEDLGISAGSDFDELSLDLEDQGDSESFAASTSDQDELGLGLGLDLDLDSAEETEPKSDDDGIIDFSGEFSDSDTSDGGLSLDLDLDEPVSETDTNLDLGLDLDLEEDGGLAASADGFGSELSLDLDGEESENDSSSEISFELEEPSDAAKPSLTDSLMEETSADDLLADLEFGGDDLDLGEADKPAASEKSTTEFELDFDLDEATEKLAEEPLVETPKAVEPEISSSVELDDDFDMDMGDLDLAALDQEMDELVGGLDDIDDEEPVAAATEVMSALEEDFSEKDLGIEEVEDSSKTKTEPGLDLDDFGDDLAFGAVGATADEAASGDGGIDEDMNTELDFLADTDEVATKLDLARAYIDMGDKDGAKDILDEVSSEGNAEQQKDAKELLDKLS